ncbi:MAG: PEP/pyruvate-binding domain-containing protein, partial [Thiohalomonadales bacterium]
MSNTESINTNSLSQDVLLDWQSAAHLGSKNVGGKAWNLGRLQQFGFNVPAGGVLATSHYLQFIEENSLAEPIRSASESITLQNINSAESELCITTIQTKIQQGVFPATMVTDLVFALENKQLLNKPLAIRSSASAEDSIKASFAGIHDSFLNINGIDPIIAAIKSCYASVWSKRAVSYRRKMQIHDQDVLPAVVIMQLIDADAAGVAFSCDPVSGREDICLVNANFGLGESVVNGSIEPDSYRINRYSFITEDKQRGKKQHATRVNKLAGTSDIATEQVGNPALQWVLSNTQQEELGLLINRVFSALSPSEVHQDIEWAIKDNIFYLLQARPVTVLPRYTTDVLGEQPDIWSNSNFRDALPMVV